MRILNGCEGAGRASNALTDSVGVDHAESFGLIFVFDNEMQFTN